MLSEKIKQYFLWFLLFIGATAFSGYLGWKTSHLQNEIMSQKNLIARMKLEHEAATIAVNEAYQEKREIYERAKDRLCEAEKKLGDNFGFCNMDIPDDIRLLWEKSNPTTESLIQSSSGTNE